MISSFATSFLPLWHQFVLASGLAVPRLLADPQTLDRQVQRLIQGQDASASHLRAHLLGASSPFRALQAHINCHDADLALCTREQEVYPESLGEGLSTPALRSPYLLLCYCASFPESFEVFAGLVRQRAPLKTVIVNAGQRTASLRKRYCHTLVECMAAYLGEADAHWPENQATQYLLICLCPEPERPRPQLTMPCFVFDPRGHLLGKERLTAEAEPAPLQD